jgi:hypothetical protein
MCHAAGINSSAPQSVCTAKKLDDDSGAQELHVGLLCSVQHWHMCFWLCAVRSDLVSIPAQLLDVLQELVGAHVGCVQAGLMLASHLRGPGRGFLTPGFICTHRQGKLSSNDGFGWC